MKNLIVITGPTASGKTAVAIKLASVFDSEIINADSRQFYKQMNIGTAKPASEELKSITHHLIDYLDVNEKYNIGKFEQDAIGLLDQLFRKKDIIFLTGGSGLYIDAVCKGIDELPESSDEIREELQNIYQAGGIDALRRNLKESDPEYYSKIDTNNPQRLMRALEITMITGKSNSELKKGQSKSRDFTVNKIGLLVARDELYDKINKRVDNMIEKGLVDEVKSLLPYRKENALQTVGYKEIFDFLDNKTTLDEAIQLIKQNTRNYAKRQMTWFRKDPTIQWFEPHETEKMIDYVNSLIT